jgi:hypothetical protein
VKAREPALALRGLAALVVALVVTEPACFVDPYDQDEHVAVGWVVDLGRLGAALTVLPGEREPDGLLHLEGAGAYVQVAVTAPDLAGLLLASWPPEGGGGSLAEPIVLSLRVPPGHSRRFELLAYVVQSTGVRVWSDDGALVVDLSGGSSSRLEARLQAVPTAGLGVTLAGASDHVVAAWVVDGEPSRGAVAGPGVAWPPVAVFGARLALSELPSGRPLSLRLADSAGRALAHDGAVWVLAPGEQREVVVTIDGR